MADFALGAGKDGLKAVIAIMEMVDTFHENDEDCQKLQMSVDVLLDIQSRLKERGLTSDLELDAPARALQRSLDSALKIVNKWQARNGMRRFFTARGMAKKLSRVKDDILQNMVTEIYVDHKEIKMGLKELRMEWTRITTVRYEGAHPLPTQLQDAAYSRHSTVSDAGSVEYHDEIMVTTGTEEAPFAPSSSVRLSETVATHDVSEDSINGGSYTIVRKQKIVFKVSMPCDKSRSKAIKLIAKAHGVSSIGLTGDGRDLLEVVGDSVDAVSLVICLRKKIGYSEILQVEAMEDKKPDERKPEEPLPGESSSSMTSSEATPQDCNNQHQEHCGTPIHRAKASGDPIEKPQLQPEAPPARVHRGAGHSRMMRRTQPALSSQRCGARVLGWLVLLCALCALVLLASVWALR